MTHKFAPPLRFFARCLVICGVTLFFGTLGTSRAALSQSTDGSKDNAPDLATSLHTPDSQAIFAPVDAKTIDIDALIYQRRPVIVFANSPNDPNFIRQMDLLRTVYDMLALRDVILITDTDPQAQSALRKRVRPNGFSLVLMDKDWRSLTRKPLPWEGREIVNAIDRMPLARTEALERSPAGR